MKEKKDSTAMSATESVVVISGDYDQLTGESLIRKEDRYCEPLGPVHDSSFDSLSSEEVP